MEEGRMMHRSGAATGEHAGASAYRINGPALISFSGGRTSAFMLHEIIRAHDGQLPADVIVAFANTGKEREETLRFVHECASRWDVKVHWLEWRRSDIGFDEVGFNSASRNGEPFKALIDWKQRLPNSFERWCTEFLKVRTLFAFARSIGFQDGQYAEVIGLRADEGSRILKAFENANFVTKKGIQVPRVPPRKVAFPLAKANIAKADVMGFWLGIPARFPSDDLPQGFDLGLADHEGNCDLCFLKGKGIRKRIIRDRPGVATWWNAREVEKNGWFDKRDRVAELINQVVANPSFFDEFDEEEYDVECGLHCALEAAE
ncbi:phosphoadenosine phosphosulfate reductase family protein [Mesorhizobium sp. CAU 1741]|uniref:phosphoadenosine phosphosulfate reductase domain-containing protein n=1 Tax=Mesorhizobium sp. CAU 1741 TaxID=3140366 RepID=UPI00325B094F